MRTEAFLYKKGELCPVCESKEIEFCGELTKYDPGKIAIDARCRDCDATWTEDYALVDLLSRSDEE